MTIFYIDPGTGSMLISALIALVSVGFFMIKGFIYEKLNVGDNKGANIDLSKNYGLVFYSEGKQYWSTFKPLLDECSRRGIPATYFTSGEDDPGLHADLEHIDAQYIGTGQESFYVLNRLIADMVVLTTPGLDVLEIKRSKNVKHYSHVTHAPGCIAGYKAYSVDYYDSVLLGGDGDIDVIAELEDYRGTPKKEVKVIGHTYLDVYRENLQDREKYTESFFDNDRPVVLVSPTWGNHSLLENYGKKLLSTLEEADAFNVIIRAHPQSFISQEELMDDLMTAFPANANRVWDRNVDGLVLMSQADIMISDFSGIIFDFVSLFGKPILTMNAQYEKRGRDATDIKKDPWDLTMVATFGQTIDEADIEDLPSIIQDSLGESFDITERIAEVKHIFDKYPNEAAIRGVDFISEKLAEIQTESAEEEKEQLMTQHKTSSNVIFKGEKSSGIIGAFKEMFGTLTRPDTFLQIALTLLLLVTYIFGAQAFLPPEGLSQEFLEKLLPYIGLVTLAAFAVFILLTWIKGKGTVNFKKSFESTEFRDLLLVGLPIAPIGQYIVANQDMLSVMQSGKVILYFLILSVLGVVLIPFILSPIISKSLSTPISLGFLFVLLNMASFGRVTPLTLVTLILAILFIAVFLLLFYKQKNILLVASSLFFITNIGTAYFGFGEEDAAEGISQSEQAESRILKYTAGKTPVNTPDVFLLIYESYSNQETMDFYGYDNREQTQYLQENGFAIYDGTYSLGPSSLRSIARVLETDYMGDEEEMREIVAAEAGALRLFNGLDYTTHTAVSSDYMTKGFMPEYDYVFPDTRYSIDPDEIIIKAVLEGEFRFDADFSTIDYDSYVEYKQNVLARDLSEPEFMYTHNNYPGHSQNSGVLRPDEMDLHFEGIVRANQEMRDDIEAIQLENRDAIVIVAGDHGPYLTKNGIGLSSYDLAEVNQMDIQDRYGAFLAIHWPDSTYEEKYDIQVLQDVIPAVISYMYEDDRLFDDTRMDRETFHTSSVSGAVVRDGIIIGGADDGRPLFEKNGVRPSGTKKTE